MRILCEHLVPPRKLLGIDFGTRFLGLAISDGSNLIARPLAVFDERSASVRLMA
jgi:RNase H-fold protein (predicted Holliday junction resolvase)